MSETSSTKPVTAKQPDDSTRLSAGAFDTEADRLIEDVFSDVDSVLDRDFGLPQEPVQPQTVAVKPVQVPPIIMRPLVVPRPSEPPKDDTDSTVTVKATQTQTTSTAGEAFDKFLLGAACASLVATLGLWLWRDEVQQFVQNRLVPTPTPTATTTPPVPEDPQVTADREFVKYMERSLERINTKFGGGSGAKTKAATTSAAAAIPPQATLNIPIDPASIDDIAGSLKEIATVLGRNTTPVARLPQPPNASNPTPPTATANGNNNGNGGNANNANSGNGNASPAPAAAPAAAPPVAAAEPEVAEETEQIAAAASTPAEPEYTEEYSEPEAVWEPEYTEEYAEDYSEPAWDQEYAEEASEPQPVWEPEYTEDYSEPAPEKPTVASAADPAEAAAEAAPSNVHTLMGFLEFGDRSAALFEINGVAQRINVGETVGGSGWSLVEVSNQQAVVRRNGEVRSVYVGQQF